jgi:hypothetical protein
MPNARRLFAAAVLCSLLPACDLAGDDAAGPADLEAALTKGGAFGKADASVEAVIVDFEFDGVVIAASSFNPSAKIEDQLLYTIGHLNGDNSVGRLDQLQLSDVSTTVENGKVVIRYHARIPVAWGDKANVPQTYELTLPADISSAAQTSFTNAYNHSCVDFGAHDVTPGSMWYYYRPHRGGCQLADADVVKVTADVSVSPINTTGKYPEYHEVWKDDVLQVVAVFGKYEDGATTSGDAGISAYNRFARSIGQELGQFDLTTEPASIPTNPGIAMPEVVFHAALPDGKAVEVVALLVDNVRTAGPEFDDRYHELTPDADLIIYNGHAGLGANIRALAQKGDWRQGQYAMVFMNGCDTYAYIDSALYDAHRAVNPDDTTGTKYVDIITNAMPSFFSQMPSASMALVRGLLSYEQPQTYEQMFVNIDSDEVVLVSGEQDNVFQPGGDDDDDDATGEWDGLDETGTVARNQEIRFQTPPLAAGRYAFEMTGTSDADLYVRTGLQPTSSQYECRPYKTGSIETCVVELSSPATIHVMVRGWATSSSFELTGRLD